MGSTLKQSIRRRIRPFWREHEGSKYFNENWDDGKTCFACGLECETLCAAHIKPRMLFEDKAEADVEINLHLLCEVCHVSSEKLIGNAYWFWMDLMRQCYSKGLVGLQNVAKQHNGTLAIVSLSKIVLPSRLEKPRQGARFTHSYEDSTGKPFVYEEWMDVYNIEEMEA